MYGTSYVPLYQMGPLAAAKLVQSMYQVSAWRPLIVLLYQVSCTIALLAPNHCSIVASFGLAPPHCTIVPGLGGSAFQWMYCTKNRVGTIDAPIVPAFNVPCPEGMAEPDGRLTNKTGRNTLDLSCCFSLLSSLFSETSVFL